MGMNYTQNVKPILTTTMKREHIHQSGKCRLRRFTKWQPDYQQNKKL